MEHPVLDLQAALVGFPSLSHEEGPIADWTEAHARKAGLAVGRLENNVWGGIGEGDDVFLLASHLDVVPPSEGHPYPPFEPTRVDGKVYGRGAVDAKASGAAMLQAVIEMHQEGFLPSGGRVVVALTACEEAGRGYNGLEHLRRDVFGHTLPQVRAALVGEPTALRPCLAQKGLLILEATAHGRTAHAARAHLGDNAITKAARDVGRIATLTFDRDDPWLGRPTATVTTIAGGTARNVVPDRCSFFVDVRSTPAYTHAELAAQVAAGLESEVSVYSDRLIPCSTGADVRIAVACRTALEGLGLDSAPFGSPTASDWIFLHDVPAVKLGPGRSELSHTADEHVEAAEVVRGVEVYKRVVRAYFGG
ncbi:MAG TPA: M20/M25/M40 family metallo-hydrolase [Rhodothermales bacterium]|nr:M20/M25/M40 family metallo-hydrolase [Rhodothermales bacterium]